MTAIQTFKPVFYCSFALFMLMMNLIHTEGAEPKREPEEKSVTELQRERLAALGQLVEVSFAAYKTGEVNIEQGLQAHQQLLDAKLELTTDRESRLKILRESVQLADEWQKVAAARYRAALTSQADVLRCRVYRLTAEIALRSEKDDKE